MYAFQLFDQFNFDSICRQSARFHVPPVVVLGVLLLQPFAVLPLFLCLLRIERTPHCFQRLNQEYGVECFAEQVM